MRLCVTADLHFDNRRSFGTAVELAHQLNDTPFDVLLIIGDVGNGDDPALVDGLSRFTHPGPKLFVPGNHELWTRRDSSLHLLNNELPRKIADAGWTWLPGSPFTQDDIAIVGSLGWYDYSFAADYLQIPRRFYEAKVSPGFAGGRDEFAHLFEQQDDLADLARHVVGRWNDGKFVKLPMPDDRFCDMLLDQLERDLDRVSTARHIVAAIHHVPLPELLPPLKTPTWDFARAYLGSPRFGQLLLQKPNVRHILCGHSHHPAESTQGHARCINLGSGYMTKMHLLLEL